jgi:DNA polymerase III sliding clamp (beta) subunit (PCNA family)
MKAECLKEKFYIAVSKAEKITGKNMTLPILSCVLIEAKNNFLTIKATNLDLGIEIKIPAKVSQEGVVTVPGAILNGFLANLNNDKNELSVEDLKLKLDNQKALKTMSLLEFCSILEIVNFEDKSMKVKGSRGRLVNSSFNFHSSYDLYEIKEMKIKSKHYVPVIAG